MRKNPLYVALQTALADPILPERLQLRYPNVYTYVALDRRRSVRERRQRLVAVVAALALALVAVVLL